MIWLSNQLKHITFIVSVSFVYPYSLFASQQYLNKLDNVCLDFCSLWFITRNNCSSIKWLDLQLVTL